MNTWADGIDEINENIKPLAAVFVKQTVALECGTVGISTSNAEVGKRVRVKLHDENGNEITADGIVAELLEVEEIAV